jgi:hypothetical protein
VQTEEEAADVATGSQPRRPAPISLGAATTGIDDRNVGLVAKVIRHASGRRQFRISARSSQPTVCAGLPVNVREERR